MTQTYNSVFPQKKIKAIALVHRDSLVLNLRSFDSVLCKTGIGYSIHSNVICDLHM